MDSYDDLRRTTAARLHHIASRGEDLAGSISEWLAGKHLTTDSEIAADRLSWQLTLQVTEPPPLEKWGFIFGDAVGGLRAVLNNLLKGISEVENLSLQHPRRLQFPIAETTTEWRSQSGWIAELPVHVQQAIERVQPFQRAGPDGTPQTDGILLLRRLSNVDKHEVALEPVINPQTIQHQFSVEFHSEEDAAADGAPQVEINPALQDGAVLIRQTTKHPIAKVKGTYDIQAQAVVVDPIVGPVGLTSGLAALLTHVDLAAGYVLAQASGTPSHK